MNEAKKSSSTANNKKRRTHAPVEDTGAQVLTTGTKMDNFDDSPYYLMLLNNAIQNEKSTVYHRSGTIFQISPVMIISSFRRRVLLIETGY